MLCVVLCCVLLRERECVCVQSVHLIHKNKIMVDEILGAACLYFMRILTIRNIDATNIAGVFEYTLQAHFQCARKSVYVYILYNK